VLNLFFLARVLELGDKLGPSSGSSRRPSLFELGGFSRRSELLAEDAATARSGMSSMRAPQLLPRRRLANCFGQTGSPSPGRRSAKFPAVEEDHVDFVYLGLRSCAREPTGTRRIARPMGRERARVWAAEDRDGILYFINGAKNPAPRLRLSLIQSAVQQ